MNLTTLLKQKKPKDHLEKTLTIKNSKNVFSNILKFLQELGKVLQFPIVVLPFAAILNRFGALGIQFTSHSVTVGDVTSLIKDNEAGYWISYIVQSGGKVVFDNLGLFFGIGVAFGLAKDHRGEAALVGGLFYLAIKGMTGVAGSFPSMFYDHVLLNNDGKSQLLFVNITYVLDIGVLGGIVGGGLSAWIYNKYCNIKLPQALSFFGGRRFVPMVALVMAIPVGLLFAAIWPWINYGLIKFGTFTLDNRTTFGTPLTAVYAIFNRLLLPFGLHQILNTLFWFQVPLKGDIIASWTGNVIGQTSTPILGDINAFTAGVAGSGIFQSGFFPIMMGGIPAIALAMIMTADKPRRKEVAGFLGGVALVSFVSGITEPIEFSFVFIAPLLLGVHAILSGIFMAITTAMGTQIGFGFSAGLIDYIVSFAQSWGFAKHAGNIAANPLWTLLMVLVCGGTYFGIFYFLIKKLNIQTIGREKEVLVQAINNENTINTTLEKQTKTTTQNKVDKYQQKAEKLIEAIGKDNIVMVDNCTTRLRLNLKDTGLVDQTKVKQAGAFGTVVLSKESMQIVIGTDVEQVADIMKSLIK